MVFEEVLFRFETTVRLDESIREDRPSLATVVPYIRFRMLEEICKGMHGKDVVSLQVYKPGTMGDVDARTIKPTGRTIVPPFAKMEDELLAITNDVTTAARVRRSGVSITKLKEITFLRS